MLTEELRTFLYPLGILATLVFALRFGIQWIQSEKAHTSKVTPVFWWLSIVGNISLIGHTLIQGQFPVCLVQSVNGVIACRNLNLMQNSKKRWELRSVLILLLFAILFPLILFWFISPQSWFRVPTHLLQPKALAISGLWHVIGALGVILHSSRFWVQWIQAEQTHKSSLEIPFWWLSIFGAIFSLIYFAVLKDYINLVGPVFGLIPYCRNLVLLYRSK